MQQDNGAVCVIVLNTMDLSMVEASVLFSLQDSAWLCKKHADWNCSRLLFSHPCVDCLQRSLSLLQCHICCPDMWGYYWPFFLSAMSLENQPTSWFSLPVASKNSRNVTETQDTDVWRMLCPNFGQIVIYLFPPTIGSSWSCWWVIAAHCCYSWWNQWYGTFVSKAHKVMITPSVVLPSKCCMDFLCSPTETQCDACDVWVTKLH